MSGDVKLDGTALLFVAEFMAQVHHNIEEKSYGPDECRKCGRDSWPHDPLPVADWSAVDA